MQVIEPACPIPPQEQILRQFSFSDGEVSPTSLLLQLLSTVLYLTPAPCSQTNNKLLTPLQHPTLTSSQFSI